MSKECSDCIHLEYDNDGECCDKGHELLLSGNIPDDCNDFKCWWD